MQQPALAVYDAGITANAGKRLNAIAAHARKLGYGGIDAWGTDGKGEKPLSRQIRDSFAHLVVENLVVFIDISVGSRVAVFEEHFAPDLVCRYRGVDDGKLYGSLCPEVIEQLTVCAEDSLLVFFPSGLVADIREANRLRKQAVFNLRYPIFIKSVVADVVEHVFCCKACASLSLRLCGEFLFLIAQTLVDVGFCASFRLASFLLQLLAA